MINFAILVWFLYWVLADKIKEFFGGRREDIKTALEEARSPKKKQSEN